jgi:deoxyribonuclease V
VALLPRHAKSRPLYVSPGHRVDVQLACDIARQLLHDHRLPEPIFWADRLSHAAARAATAPAGAGQAAAER